MEKQFVQEENRKLRFDFVIYDQDGSINRIIEFDGRQHKYGPDTNYWGHSTDNLADIQERDALKNNFCLRHNYKFTSKAKKVIEIARKHQSLGYNMI